MSELTEQLCSIRLEQKGTCHLLPPSSFESLLKKAEEVKKSLEIAVNPIADSPEKDELNCIIKVMDDIQQYRAEIIWSLARDSDGDTTLMTAEEAEIYRILMAGAQKLWGYEA